MVVCALKRLHVMQVNAEQNKQRPLLWAVTLAQDLKYRIAMHNVFPITDNIPGHIMCTRAADAHAWTDYLDKFGITGLPKVRASIRLCSCLANCLDFEKTAN
ncbi:hypothetical protein BSLG_005828 [Batrachochytrium salamandrivorans]|nr:hypothetical protein BSLG_005828 [Batrachochytrium salamandrivorans]